MKKNRLFALLCAGALSASMLTACGGSQDSSANNASSDASTDSTETAEDTTSLKYIQDKGTLVLGLDDQLPPMGFLDESGTIVGFDIDVAEKVCEKLGVELVTQPINWDSKQMELDTKNIDCIWNGMTITPELQEAISISDPYIKNYQVVVIRAADADKYTSTESLAGANLDAEAGSAGEAAVAADEFLSQASYTSVVKQTDALLEVKSGAADAAVMDFVLANTLAGTGDYSDLMVIPDLELSVEEYGIGFRQGSDLTAAVNQAMQELIDDGTLNELAVKYELADLLLANQ